MTAPTIAIWDLETLTGHPKTVGIDEVNGLDPTRTALTDLTIATADLAVRHVVDPTPALVHDAKLGGSVYQPRTVTEYTTASDGRDITTVRHPSEGEGIVAFLRTVKRFRDDLGVQMLAGWNDSVFDVVMLLVRARLNGLHLSAADVQITPFVGREPKYDPTPGLTHDESAVYQVDLAGLDHVDLAYAYKGWASDTDVRWSLKPVLQARGYDPVVVDRERMHELTDAERAAYAISDVVHLHDMAVADWDELDLGSFTDQAVRVKAA